MKTKKSKTKKSRKATKRPAKTNKLKADATFNRVELVLTRQDFQDIVSCLAFTGIGEACIPLDEPFRSRVQKILGVFADNGVKLNNDVEFWGQFESPNDEALVKRLDGKINND